MRKVGLAAVLLGVTIYGASPVRADITNWQTGQIIPGTEGIGALPGVNLSGWNTPTRNLRYADLAGSDLEGSYFAGSWLDSSRFSEANLVDADFGDATLMGADFARANLTRTSLAGATLHGADFHDASITGGLLARTTAQGFTSQQLYSTASYKKRDLSGVRLGVNDLSGWSFEGQDLTGASFWGATVSGADFSGATVRNASFHYAIGFTNQQLYSTSSYGNRDLRQIGLCRNDLSNWSFAAQNLTGADLNETTLTNADFTDAVITGACFGGTTGFTEQQLASTASYKGKDLYGLALWGNDLTGWSFAGQDLTYAYLGSTTLAGTDLTDAIITNADFYGVTFKGFTKDQFYQTASYKTGDLRGVRLYQNNLSGWNLARQNLTRACFWKSNLSETDFTDSCIVDADFVDTTSGGFTSEQLYATASYKAKDMHRIRLDSNDLSGWNLAGQNLAYASFESAVLAGTVFADAVITNADFGNTTSRGFTSEQLYSTASYRDHDLSGLDLYGNDLSGWDLSGQSLINAGFAATTLTGTSFDFADLRYARHVDYYTDLDGYRNVIRPDGTIKRLELRSGERLLIHDCTLAVTVLTGFTADGYAELELLLTEPEWNSVIGFEQGLIPDLGGTLRLTLADSLDSGDLVGMTFKLFDWPGVLGGDNTFDEIATNLPNGLVWDTSMLYSTGEITLVPEPAVLMWAFVFVMPVLRRQTA